MGIDGQGIRDKNMYHALIGQASLQEVIVKTLIPHLDLAPANQELVGIEIEFVSLHDREKKLRHLIRNLRGGV